MPCLPSTSQDNNHHQQQIATIETRSESIPIPIVTCDFASDVSTSEAAEMESAQNYEKDTLKVCSLSSNLPISSSVASSMIAPNASKSNTNGSSSPSNELKVSPSFNRCRALSVGIDNDMVSEFDPSSSDSGVISRCAVVKPLKFRLCQPIFGKRSHHKSTESAKVQHKHNMVESTELEPAIPKVQKQRDPEKEKRRIARKKEKRATLILGLIMGSFIACWLPFFFMYILTPMCTQCDIPESAFDIAFWLGYMNSALNPAIYTIFNKDFRRAFRRILFK